MTTTTTTAPATLTPLQAMAEFISDLVKWATYAENVTVCVFEDFPLGLCRYRQPEEVWARFEGVVLEGGTSEAVLTASVRSGRLGISYAEIRRI
jgi:hypothetical protein